ncbi:hypothetical protein [Aquimarina sp. Aq107]|uniref:hypothetical protein n=1 Tax=Aquimarina sp. Aq107 TaxID=1191912 RepID=UPI00131EE6C8|nr:hypothetical protein [Aquimarina sp. Aq107]
MKRKLFFMLILLLGFVSHSQTVLDFTYDPSGNQMLRKEGTASRSVQTAVSDSISYNKDPLNELTAEVIENHFTVSPNPTTGAATLRWDPMFSEQIINIELISLITSEKTPIKRTRGNSLSIDLSGKVTGLYVVTFYLNNETVNKVQKKIIKL